MLVGAVLVGWEVLRVSVPLSTTPWALRVDFGSDGDPEPVVTDVVEPVVVEPVVVDALVPVVPDVEVSEEWEPDVVSLLDVVPVEVPVVVLPVVLPVVDSLVVVDFDPVSDEPAVDEEVDPLVDDEPDSEAEDDEPEESVVSAQARP